MSDPVSVRVLGLTRRDRITLFIIVVVFVSGVTGGWFVRRSRETILPAKEDAVICVDINSADQRELTLLPGIGDKTARLIVASREKEGPFETLGSLSRVAGIGRSTIKRITPYAECR